MITEEKKIRQVKTCRRLSGDNAKLCAETGWMPQIPFEKTLDDLFAYWVGELKKEGTVH